MGGRSWLGFWVFTVCLGFFFLGFVVLRLWLIGLGLLFCRMWVLLVGVGWFADCFRGVGII